MALVLGFIETFETLKPSSDICTYIPQLFHQKR
jgi:hypothetical protein